MLLHTCTQNMRGRLVRRRTGIGESLGEPERVKGVTMTELYPRVKVLRGAPCV